MHFFNCYFCFLERTFSCDTFYLYSFDLFLSRANEPKQEEEGYSTSICCTHIIAEIESMFKKIKEGFEEFDSIWDRVSIVLFYMICRYIVQKRKLKRKNMKEI